MGSLFAESNFVQATLHYIISTATLNILNLSSDPIFTYYIYEYIPIDSPHSASAYAPNFCNF